MLALLLGAAVVVVVLVGATTATHQMDAPIEAPTNDGASVVVTYFEHCGSVISPIHKTPPTGWVYAGDSCEQKLALYRRSALVWLPLVAITFGVGAVLANLVRRRRTKTSSSGGTPVAV